MMFPKKSTGLVVLLLLYQGSRAQEADDKTHHYVRPAPKGWAKECSFSLQADKTGWTVTSVTTRGDSQLTLVSKYDIQDHLTSATVVLAQGKEKASAQVEVTKGKGKVVRPGLPAKEFDLPRGVIVTSAPDWTDLWLLCRRYDRKQGGPQTFPGLWIHPTLAPQGIPFKIERVGQDVIEHQGKKLNLDRFTIRIRGPKPYVAWADDQGRLVKLAPLPYQAGSGIVREEFAAAAKDLGPGLK